MSIHCAVRTTRSLLAIILVTIGVSFGGVIGVTYAVNPGAFLSIFGGGGSNQWNFLNVDVTTRQIARYDNGTWLPETEYNLTQVTLNYVAWNKTDLDRGLDEGNTTYLVERVLASVYVSALTLEAKEIPSSITWYIEPRIGIVLSSVFVNYLHDGSDEFQWIFIIDKAALGLFNLTLSDIVLEGGNTLTFEFGYFTCDQYGYFTNMTFAFNNNVFTIEI